MAKTRDITQRELLILTRKAAAALQEVAPTATTRLALCKQLLAGKATHKDLTPLLDQIGQLRIDERHYWIGTLYSLLLPAQSPEHIIFPTGAKRGWHSRD